MVNLSKFLGANVDRKIRTKVEIIMADNDLDSSMNTIAEEVEVMKNKSTEYYLIIIPGNMLVNGTPTVPVGMFTIKRRARIDRCSIGRDNNAALASMRR